LRVHGAEQAGQNAGRRRALLIGVTETPDLTDDPELAEAFAPLPCVDGDVVRLRRVLEQSGYEVTACHPGSTDPARQNVSRNKLRSQLRTFLASCAPGDTALLYLSGHGEFIQGRDYLLPSDAQPGELLPDGVRELDRGSLLAADSGLLIGDVHPDVTIAVFLDICRTQGPGRADEREDNVLTKVRNAFWLYSSSKGQESYADPERGSLFCHALTRALDPGTPPTTFGAILKHTETTLRKLFTGRVEQRPDLQPYLNREADDTLELCSGSQRSSRWAQSVTDSELWQHTSGSPELHRLLKERLVRLVDEVAGLRAGPGAHRDDPWTDPERPDQVAQRTVAQLGSLLSRAGLTEPERLSPSETAVLLAAPVLHEGIVTLVLHDLKAVFGRDLGADPVSAVRPGRQAQVYADAVDVPRAHSQIKRTADTLRLRGLTDAARAADHWLRHRFLADWDLPWLPQGPYPEVDRLIRLIAEAVCTSEPDSAPGSVDERVRLQIRQVAGNLTVKPADSPRINDSNRSTGDRWDTSEPVAGHRWRGRELAQLLWIAAQLAADPRRMPGVLVDHLAAHTPLRPADVLTALSSNLHYTPREGRWDVHFSCPHPALHLAVEQLVDRADSAVRALHEDGPVAPLLRGVPHRVTASQLRPQMGEDGNTYEIPLEQFRLAEDEIRPLLMGVQLYGDPMLAVRELYQNALDACRYRTMRDAYGSRGGPPPRWGAPRITFTEGKDEQGRPYIQCEDTGVGMSREALTSMFARAGKRYEQNAQYIQERRNWRRAEIPVIPLNSRFGIGVFSYFMLAEEIVVRSTPVDLNGSPLPGESVHAEIQAGSGLLQFRRPDPSLLREGGTRVRLYLPADPDEQRASLVETLREHLWVSDYEVISAESDTGGEPLVRERWRPGELCLSDEWYGEPLRAGPDAWLVQGSGQLLLDGVLVKDAGQVHGYVANLRERHRPVPSVDRNRMLSYDEEGVMDELLAAVPKSAPAWNEVSLTALWKLADHEPRLTVALMEALLPKADAVLDPDSEHDVRVRFRRPLAGIGCFLRDRKVAYEEAPPPMLLGRIQENNLLAHWHESRRGWENGPHEKFLPSGYPSPSALDALLFGDEPIGTSCSTALHTAAAARVPLGDTVRALRRYAVAGLHVPPVADIRGLRNLMPTPVMADLYDEYRAAANMSRHAPTPAWAVHAPLVQEAAKWSLPLKEMTSALRELGCADRTLPCPPELVGDFTEVPLRRDEIVLGFLDHVEFTGVPSPTGFGIWHGTAFSKERVEQRFQQLAPLGLVLQPGWDDRLLHRSALGKWSLRLLSRDLDGMGPWRTSAPTLPELVRMSGKLRRPVDEIAEQLAELLDGIGVEMPTVPAEVAGWTAPDWLADFLDSRPGIPLFLTPWQIVLGVWVYPGKLPEPDRLSHDLRMLALCGLLPDGSTAYVAPILEQVGQRNRLQLPLDPLFFDPLVRSIDAGEISPADLVQYGTFYHCTLGQAAAVFHHTATALPLNVCWPADLSGEASHLAPSPQTQQALLQSRGGRQHRFSDTLTILDLLVHADANALLGRPGRLADTLDELSPYVPLGAPPAPGDFTGPDAELLADFVPDDFDLAAFDKGLLGPGTLGPLELVLVAGRFGWTLGETYDRYAPFRCLGLHVTVDEPSPEEADLRPDWRDVILLTTELTGRAPALSGAVDPDHVLLCSEETDLSTAEVRDRLISYASLFSLELPPLEG
jgi:hypothetical protein